MADTLMDPVQKAPAALAPPGADPLYADEAEDGIDLHRIAGAVLRYKWPILALTVIGTTIGFLVVQRLPSEYQAQAMIWIEQSTMNQGESGPIQTENLLDASAAWVELLKSYSVLDHVVRERRLYLTPATASDESLFRDFALAERFVPGDYRLQIDGSGTRFLLAESSMGVVERGHVGDEIGSRVGLDWTPPATLLTAGRIVEFRVSVPREISLALADAMKTRVAERGSFLRVELVQPEPIRAAGVLNAVLDRYIEIATELKRAKLDELTTILAEQLQTAETNLRKAEIALEGFRVHAITLPAENASPVTPGLESTQASVLGRYFEMKVGAEELRMDRAAVIAALESGSGMVEALEVIPAVASSSALQSALQELTLKQAELRALRYQYTDEYAPVQRLAEQVRTLHERTIPELARQLERELASREAQLGRQVASASGELREIPPRMIEEARLRRRVSIAETLYTTLQERYEEARLAAASSIPDVRILDRAAVPRQPVENRKPLFIFVAFAASLGLGIAGAVLRDRFDPRIRYPAQVTSELGLPILGGVPQAKRKGRQLVGDAMGQLLEAFRTLRLNVIHAHGAGPIIVTVSSPGSGDGKSFVTSTLGLVFGDLGYRTVIIDGDIRRGVAEKLLNRGRSPGLIEFLQGHAEVDDVIQPTDYPNVDLVASGARTPRGPELLGSARMKQLLLDLRMRYDAILIDSPPLAVGSDPLVLGTLTGSMLLVLRAGTTDRPMTEAKLDLLDRLPIRLLGVALNSVPDKGAYRYYSYLRGYRIEEAEAAGSLAGGALAHPADVV
ncbi:MAG: GumC family protein [Longimicrobiales bacterium]